MRYGAHAAVLLCLVCGCSTRDSALPTDVTNALATAFTKGDVQACADLYSDDAEILSARTKPVRGREGIEAFFRDQVARDILFSTDSHVSLVHGDLAIDHGSYRVRDTRRGVDVEFGDYLNVWRLRDGRWRVFRSMYTVSESQRVGVTVSPDESAASPPPDR